jgi:hypothetical protein
MAKARMLQSEAGKQQAIKIRELNSLDAVNNALAGAATSAGRESASNEVGSCPQVALA